MINERLVEYSATNSYSTLNKLTDKTKNVWIVFHGLGYLSRYFINYFSDLSAEENYIIAPQAPSKYYQDKKFKHVGASWLTKENTVAETENVLRYVDSVYEKEILNSDTKYIVMGYSQGVSIATRWLASRKIKCNELILHSGAIPTELTQKDFEYLSDDCKVTYVYGDKDEYITEAKKTEQQLKGNDLFGKNLNIEVFDGKHEVNKEFLFKIATHIV